MKTYKSAIIGCGNRAKAHASAYSFISDASLVACCDLNETLLGEFTDTFQIKGYKDLTQMIEQEKPDIVHIVTPPSLRLELLKKISELGVPGCIVEKPIALGVEDYKQIKEFAANTKMKCIVNHQYRYHPNFLKCREALDSGVLGQILYMDCSCRMNINNQGTHILDYVMSLNKDSRVKTIFGNASGVDKEDLSHPAPETTLGQITFENGVKALWNTGSSAPKVVVDDAIFKHCQEAVFAEKGRILFEEFNRWEIASSEENQTGETTMDNWGEYNNLSQAGLVHSLTKWLDDDDAQSESNLELALHQWNVVLGLYASALWREPITIPFDPPIDLFEQLKDVLES